MKINIEKDGEKNIEKDIEKIEGRIAVLSDIHGNHIALQECIQYAFDREVKQFIFLGDYLGELAYPQKTMEILYALQEKYPCYFVKGNKEEYWLNYKAQGETGWKQYDSTTGSLFYTYHELTEKDIEFFSGLAISETLCMDNVPAITICHGSPYKVNEKMLNRNERTFEIMDKSETDLILCGHTHVQEKIEHNGKMVLNAGSVGDSLYAGGKAQFLLLQAKDETWEYEFVSLDYDTESVIQELDMSGLTEYAPSWTIITKYLLTVGDVSHGAVLSRAMSLCQKEMGECVWPNIPEHYWKAAVEQMLKEK